MFKKRRKGYYFLFYSCINSKKEECFYNMEENDIEQIKQRAVYQAKDEVKWGFFTIIGTIIVSFVQTFLLSRARKRDI